MYNASALLYKWIQNDRFIDNISISSKQDAMLRAARKKVRQAIRAAFSEARTHVNSIEGVHERDIEWISKIKPKFMTQGSYAYKTLNNICYNSQEIDLDDGAYLPISIIGTEPKGNKDWFFLIVDNALKKLAKQEGWVFTDKIDTCARLVLPNQAHIDVPLYAIPDERHAYLNEAVASLKTTGQKMSDVLFGGNIRTAKQLMLNDDEVYLATRNNGWKKSDPLLISNWFMQEVSIKGERLRRICRYLKAWRDFVWKTGGPSSLTLMICAAKAYPDDDQDRDDYALLTVVKSLPQILSGKITNPASKNEEVVFPRSDINCNEVVMDARAFAKTLEGALSGAFDKAQVIQGFKREFGTRMPDNINWIEELGSASVVRSTPAMTVRPEPIPNSRSG